MLPPPSARRNRKREGGGVCWVKSEKQEEVSGLMENFQLLQLLDFGLRLSTHSSS